MMLYPKSVTELQEMVRTQPCVLPVGGGSKPTLIQTPADVVRLHMGGLAGILEYVPGEYTFTAYAGTAVADIAAQLAQNGQYLPFDPVWTEAGATLGGTIAANSSGSGRYRYGGVRDFILGVQFVAGDGRLIHSGGKVVKNAAGFDLPKFFVGSMGRFGVLTVVSFKVFPQPQATATLCAEFANGAAAVQAVWGLGGRPLELDALDIAPGNDGRWQMWLRVGGLAESLPGRLARLTDLLVGSLAAMQVDAVPEEAAYWRGVGELAWAAEQAVVKVPLTGRQIEALQTAVAPLAAHARYTAGGNVAWLALPEAQLVRLHPILQALNLPGLVLRGATPTPVLGHYAGDMLTQRLKTALDPAQRFPQFSALLAK